MLFNPQIADLPIYHPGRPLEEVARELGLPFEGLIKLASNENPLGPSPMAIKAMEETASQAHMYPDGHCFYLRKRLAQKLSVNPGNLIFGNGSNEIIEFVAHAVLNGNTDIIVSQYCFAIFPIVAHLSKAKCITISANNFGHDLTAMVEAVTPKTRIMFVANPNNPTGTIAPKEEVDNLIENLPDHILLVMDEAYFEFLEDPIDFIPLVETKQNLLIMRTFSKIHGLAGLRVGYGIGHEDFIAELEKIRQPFNLNIMAQAAALAALNDDEHVRQTQENNNAGLKMFEAALSNLPHVQFVPSHANFVLVKVGDGQGVFLELQKRGIITRPMDGYQLPEWIRISIGTDEQNIRCIESLKDLL